MADIPKDSIKRTKAAINTIIKEAKRKGHDPRYTIIRINQILSACYSQNRLITYYRQRADMLFSHATIQFWFYLRAKGYKKRKRFKRRVNGKITLGFEKYSIKPPPPAMKQNLKKKQKITTQCKQDGTRLCTSRFHLRKRKEKVRRLFPNDPIVPIDGNWREMRKKVWQRDHGHCVFCGKTATEVDHVLTKKEAKCDRKIARVRDKLKYLRCICRACHYKRHGRRWSWEFIMKMIETHTTPEVTSQPIDPIEAGGIRSP